MTLGRTIVALVVLVGAALAAANIWHRWATTNRIHQRWGTQTMELVAHAPRADWLKLAPPDGAPPDGGATGATQPNADKSKGDAKSDRLRRNDGPRDVWTIDGRDYRVVARGDLTAARGFSNFRHALGQNGSYCWSDGGAASAAPMTWRWALVFEDGSRRAVLVIDKEGQRMARLEEDRPVPSAADVVDTTDKMAAGVQTFFAEQNASQ